MAKNKSPQKTQKSPTKSSSSGSTKSSEIEPTSNDNVKVFVRVRPQIKREIENNQQILIKMPSVTTTTITNPNGPDLSLSPSKKKQPEDYIKTFQFDQSIDSIHPNDPNFKTQRDTYELIGKDVLDHTLNGFNTCIFAYGQTGSGKSYTMMGNDKEEEEQGITPRVCKDLFGKIRDLELNDVKITVKFSYFEIYNEQVKDLLINDEDSNGRKLKIREDPKKGPYIENLNEFKIENYQEFKSFMDLGNKNRTIGATKMNDQSSRSHAVVTISLRITEFDESQDLIKELNSSLRLVDLAGSERASSTGATGLRFKEGSNINKSLTTLGRVISSLSKGDIKPPFRDSTLTWILKESLGGNSKTVMIACISPCDYEETLSTLRYATIAKTVKLNAVKNVDEIDNVDKATELLKMQKELEELKENLEEFKQKDDLILQITNMSKFFESRLIDQTNKYELIKLKYSNLVIKSNQLTKDFDGLVNVIVDGDSNLRSLVTEYNGLLERSDKLKLDFEKDLKLFAI